MNNFFQPTPFPCYPINNLSMNIFYLYCLKDSYSLQFLKNYDLIRKIFIHEEKKTLDFEYLYDLYNSWPFSKNIKEINVQDDQKENSKLVYVLLGLLSVFEVDRNLSHFYFVNIYFSFHLSFSLDKR